MLPVFITAVAALGLGLVIGVVLGILVQGQIQFRGRRLQGTPSAVSGLLMSCFTAIMMTFLLAIVVPNGVLTRELRHRRDCTRHLQAIAAAAQQWQRAHPHTPRTALTLGALARYLPPGVGACPPQGNYALRERDGLPRCSVHGSLE